MGPPRRKSSSSAGPPSTRIAPDPFRGVDWPKHRLGALGPAIENGSTVQLEYSLEDADGGILDSNKGRDPLVFTHGQGQIVPGLEQALTGMRTGEEKHVTVKPEEAYGMEDPAAVTEVPKEIIPANALKVGAGLVARNQTGETRLVKVKEIKEKSVVLDLNHPLAGKTLFFDVKILGVDAPKAGPPKE